MRKIDLIVIHCSATCEDRPFTGQALEAAHRRRGFDGTGYHFYIRRDGQILTTRPVERAGAHARGYNAHSIGIAYEGGLDHYGNPKDTRTEWQRHSLRVLVRALLMDYPEAKVAGHRDLSPDLNNNQEKRGYTPSLLIKYSIFAIKCVSYLIYGKNKNKEFRPHQARLSG